MRKKIAVVTGGNSSEFVISVKSADTIIENIDKTKYEPYRIEIQGNKWKLDLEGSRYEIDKNDFSVCIDGKKINFDCALIIIHGDPGEDGKLQGYFEMLGIPYTSSDVLTSALTFNKHITKKYLQAFDILSADWWVIGTNDNSKINDIATKIDFPCFVKPNNAGSSFGVSKVSTPDQLQDAIEVALSEDCEVLVEKMVSGTEITCGVLRTSKTAYTFPICEIVSKNGFFDYEAKYSVGKSDEIIPARINDSIAKQCQDLSLKIYDLLNCKWFARIDYIIEDNKLFLLEINTIPGMSKESIIPKMINVAGLELSALISEILSDVLCQ
jgi:D-alanine-D-alanine ligase